MILLLKRFYLGFFTFFHISTTRVQRVFTAKATKGSGEQKSTAIVKELLRGFAQSKKKPLMELLRKHSVDHQSR